MKKHFTLIEMMAVILIIGILIGLITALLPQLRERGRRVKCANNLRNIGAAIVRYADGNENKYPFVINDKWNDFVSRLAPYVQGQTAFFNCPSAVQLKEITYACLVKNIRPSEVTSGLPWCSDLIGNHTKPNDFGNVLFGDGGVIGFASKGVNSWADSNLENVMIINDDGIKKVGSIGSLPWSNSGLNP